MLGQKPGRVCQFRRTWVACWIEVHGPEADQRAVTPFEAVLVRRQPEETTLAGRRLVKLAQVEQRVGAKRIANRPERPEVARRSSICRRLARQCGLLREHRQGGIAWRRRCLV